MVYGIREFEYPQAATSRIISGKINIFLLHLETTETMVNLVIRDYWHDAGTFEIISSFQNLRKLTIRCYQGFSDAKMNVTLGTYLRSIQHSVHTESFDKQKCVSCAVGHTIGHQEYIHTHM